MRTLMRRARSAPPAPAPRPVSGDLPSPTISASDRSSGPSGARTGSIPVAGPQTAVPQAAAPATGVPLLVDRIRPTSMLSTRLPARAA
jgi:hypothetical protein